MDNLSFSHRPFAGVSVGAANINGKLIVAAALTNDGTTRSGIWRKERHDGFSRKVSRQIIKGRILAAAVNGAEPDFSIAFDTELNARTFMTQFRDVFKPTPDETDDVFSDVGDIEGVEYRIRKRADAIWDVIANLANEVVINAGTRV